MPLNPEPKNALRIRSWTPGQVMLGDRALSRPHILTPAELIDNWAGPDPDALTTADLQPAIDLRPEILLLGTGERQILPDISISTWVLKQGIAFEAMDTAAACRTFNVLSAEQRVVVAVLYP